MEVRVKLDELPAEAKPPRNAAPHPAAAGGELGVTVEPMRQITPSNWACAAIRKGSSSPRMTAADPPQRRAFNPATSFRK